MTPQTPCITELSGLCRTAALAPISLNRMRRAGCWDVMQMIGALAVATSSISCASTGAVPRPFPVPGGSPAAPAPHSTPTSPPPVNSRAGHTLADAYALAGTALSFRGAPYRNGGVNPDGFDCSGFTQYVFARHGVALPRDVREQYRLGQPVKPEQLAAGDLIFFSTTEQGASHVAIAIGGDEFVHAPSSSGVVRVEHIGSTYWSQRYVGARRLN